jgi:hypothetical protein
MIFPSRPPLRLCAAAAFVLGATLTSGASDKIAEAVRDSLPRYDPAQHIASERTAVPEASPPVLRDGAIPPSDAPALSPNLTDPKIVRLEPFTVRGRRSPPAVKLPRMHVSESAQPSVDASDPFLTPAERSRRWQKKHVNVLTRLLNPSFLGGAALVNPRSGRGMAASSTTLRTRSNSPPPLGRPRRN